MVVIPNIEELVTRFQDNEDAYMAPRYNEAQVRREFIDPMFRLLGWDVDNAPGYAEATRRRSRGYPKNRRNIKRAGLCFPDWGRSQIFS